MRVIVVVTILILMNIVNTTSARGYYTTRNTIKNIEKSIYNKCNKDAYHKINNIELYNCFKMNKSNYCNHLDNYTDYNKNMEICILDNNASLGSGVFISVILMLIISLCSMA